MVEQGVLNPKACRFKSCRAHQPFHGKSDMINQWGLISLGGSMLEFLIEILKDAGVIDR